MGAVRSWRCSVGQPYEDRATFGRGCQGIARELPGMYVGHTFERRVRWTHDDIVRFARDVGDSNPLHHDATYAAGTRFGGLIASGAHTVAVMMAVCGSQASHQKPGVGLEFNFRLIGAAKPGEEIVFRWEVVAIEEADGPGDETLRRRGDRRGRAAAADCHREDALRRCAIRRSGPTKRACAAVPP